MINLFNKTLFDLNEKVRIQITELHQLGRELKDIKFEQAPEVIDMTSGELLQNKNVR